MARNSSLSISNMIGPKEKMALLGHPAKGIYFTIFGIPRDVDIDMNGKILLYLNFLKKLQICLVVNPNKP